MTTDLKVGDRVHVDYYGTVDALDDGDDRPYYVSAEATPGHGAWLHESNVTRSAPIEPVWKVGDAIILTGRGGDKWTLVFDGTRWFDHEGDERLDTVVPAAWPEGRVTRLIPEVAQ